MTTASLETTGTPLEQAAQSRTIQLALASALTKDVARVWPNLDPKNLDGTFQAWFEQMVSLINRYRGMSSLAAGIYYRDTREHQTGLTTPANLIKTAGDAPAGWLQKGLGYSGPGLLNNPGAQPGTALSTTQGTAARMVADAGRTTVLDTTAADPKAVGWYRVTDGHPCGFCALLASRGVAYKAEDTADFKSHNDCGCTAAPAFTRSQELPAISGAADAIYREHVAHLPNGQRLAAFRKAWDQQHPAQ